MASLFSNADVMLRQVTSVQDHM